MNLVELEYITPPEGAQIFGVPIGTVEDATAIWLWAVQTPGYTCTLTAGLDGQQTIQIEGVKADTIRSPIGGDRWIVYNNGSLELYETAADALEIYKLKGQ